MKPSLWLRSSPILFLIFVCLLVAACQPATPTANLSNALTGTASYPSETPAAAPTEIGSWPLSPDQHWMAAQTHDGAWWMWDALSRQAVYLLNDTALHAPPIDNLTFSPDGHYLAAIGIGDALLWEVATHKRRILTSSIGLDYRSLRLLVFSPNSQFLATNGCQQQNSHMVCTGGFVNLWNTADGSLVRTLSTGFRADEIIYSADSGTLTVSGCSITDGVIGSYCYEQSQATYNLSSGERIILTRVPQFK